jgi:hypothetical protein
MKTQKILSLDYELVQKLQKENNASALVNFLIKDYYGGTKTREEIKKELELKIEEHQQTNKDLTDKLKVIEERERQREEKEQEKAQVLRTDPIALFLEDLTTNPEKKAEWLSGIRDGKWGTTTQFANFKLYGKTNHDDDKGGAE